MTKKEFTKLRYWYNEINKTPMVRGHITLFNESFHEFINDKDYVKFLTEKINVYSSYSVSIFPITNSSIIIDEFGIKLETSWNNNKVKIYVPYKYVQKTYIYNYNNFWRGDRKNIFSFKGVDLKNY